MINWFIWLLSVGQMMTIITLLLYMLGHYSDFTYVYTRLELALHKLRYAHSCILLTFIWKLCVNICVFSDPYMNFMSSSAYHCWCWLWLSNQGNKPNFFLWFSYRGLRKNQRESNREVIYQRWRNSFELVLFRSSVITFWVFIWPNSPLMLMMDPTEIHKYKWCYPVES
jgi:hypothetical protein